MSGRASDILCGMVQERPFPGLAADLCNPGKMHMCALFRWGIIRYTMYVFCPMRGITPAGGPFQ